MALQNYLQAIKQASNKGYVKSIDGRPIKVDSQHKALNYLLQSGAGVIAKRWMVLANEEITKENLPCNQLAFVHDELQFETTQIMQTPYQLSLSEVQNTQENTTTLESQSQPRQQSVIQWADVH